jgi:hypothetical protein
MKVATYISQGKEKEKINTKKKTKKIEKSNHDIVVIVVLSIACSLSLAFSPFWTARCPFP